MALYTGLSPEQALQRWFEIRQKPAEQRTPEEQQDVMLNMTGLAQENPAAFRFVASGTQAHQNAEGKNVREVFNPMTGQMDTQDVRGYWSHPESWLQLAAAGSVAAPVALSMLGGAAGGSAAGAAGGSGVGGGGTAAGLGVGATEAGVLPSTTIGTGFIPAVGGTGITGGVAGGTGAATGGSILSKIGSSPYLKNASMMGQGISAASSAAGNTRRADIDTNVGAQSAFNSALLGRAALEQKQRDAALRDVYAAGYFRDQPRSPYNPAPVRGISQNYLQALGGLEGQAMQRLQQGPQYGTNQMPQLQPYSTRPSTGERIGSYAGPILSTIGAMYGQGQPQQRRYPWDERF